jgi:hypothetical protein
MRLQVVANWRFKFGNESEDAAADSLCRNQAKEALNLIEPRG